jgi:hypothetical protein
MPTDATGHRAERHFCLGRVCDDSSDQEEVYQQSGDPSMQAYVDLLKL